MFDNLVAPVMLYCSELWGLTCAEKDTTPYEYLHLKFIKEILGVHSKTSNDACRAELNRLHNSGQDFKFGLQLLAKFMVVLQQSSF